MAMLSWFQGRESSRTTLSLALHGVHLKLVDWVDPSQKVKTAVITEVDTHVSALPPSQYARVLQRALKL